MVQITLFKTIFFLLFMTISTSLLAQNCEPFQLSSEGTHVVCRADLSSIEALARSPK